MSHAILPPDFGATIRPAITPATAPPKNASAMACPEPSISRLSIAIPPWISSVLLDLKRRPCQKSRTIESFITVTSLGLTPMHKEGKACLWGVPGPRRKECCPKRQQASRRVRQAYHLSSVANDRMYRSTCQASSPVSMRGIRAAIVGPGVKDIVSNGFNLFLGSWWN